MKAFKFILALSMMMTLAVISCQDRSNITEPQLPDSGIRLNLPNAMPDSAFFIVYVGFAGSGTVNVHRITADWAENTVTWNNFNEQFDASVVNSFLPTATGFYSVNVTSLVQGWIGGTYPNYGLLLDEGLLPLTAYMTSEWPYGTIYHPMLKLYYGATPDSIQRGVSGTVSDAYITEVFPDYNSGSVDQAYTGRTENLIKQALFKFDLPVIQELACIGDRVWFDDNHNGIQDLGEPGVQGVTVNLLDCSGNVLATDVTDASGIYGFCELTPGDYKIQFVLPNGFVFSPLDQGADDAVDSDADVTTGMTACTTLEGGETDLTWDAGIYTPDQHCTRTIGYWKTHDGSGPQEDVVTALLPIWLGTAGGALSINVTNTTISHHILAMDGTYGPASNPITKLYAQLLGAKLNAANDADISSIAATIAAADIFLATHNWLTGLTAPQKVMVLGWMTTLDNYNNGRIGPIHCD